MLKSREYIGLSIEGEFIKIARVKPHKKGLQLLRLDKIRLIEPLKSKVVEKKAKADEDDVFSDEDPDSIFGFDDEGDEAGTDEIEEIDLSSFEDDPVDFDDTDLVEEASLPRSNEELIVRYLDDFAKQKVNLALNIEAGNTIFQIFKNQNFKELKKKEVQQLVSEKLEAIYGASPLKDYYDYQIRDDGSLLISSIDEESPTLQLMNRASEAYAKDYYIQDVIPDEAAAVGLFRNHYEIEEGQITGLIQFGPEKCRMIFVRGSEILQVSPVINEGTSTKNFLNTIFSKILFQLDTGEIPGVDRFILLNNSIGDKATDFFRKNFPDLGIEDFTFNEEKFSFDESVEEIVPSYTTAIGIAAAAAGVGLENYPNITFLPDYVSDNQKKFKLQWHGYVLLIFVGLSPIILNHFYQQNSAEIDSLQSQQDRYQTMIANLQPLVQESEQLSVQLSDMQNQLSLLTDLSRDNIRWSVTMNRFNEAAEQVGGLWINSFRQNNDVLMVDGYSLTRENIPRLANQFPSVTLLSVRREEIREREIYYFNMMIRRTVQDESEFTPQRSREIDDLIN
ncbi:MAG: hypothetical protein EA390_06185 [Balneolaceae bacterium]|nr:MAG: hypothetical protein EA390_06185 [Balneolaceae bacterium]